MYSDKDKMHICALRYTLGRRTYVVSEVTSIIGQSINEYSDMALYIMHRDIDEQKMFGYGDECDKEGWMKLKEIIEMEIERRNGENHVQDC